MKPYLGGRSGAISLNLSKEQSNQQPQQQRCRAGFSEHSSSCSFTRVISDVLNLTKLCDDWTPRKKKNNQGLRQIICLFFWWRWKIFHVVMNCQKWKNNSVNEKDNSNSDRTVGSKSHRCCHRVHLGLPWLLIAIIEDVLKILNVVFTSYFNKEEQFLINLNLVLKLILFVNIIWKGITQCK